MMLRRQGHATLRTPAPGGCPHTEAGPVTTGERNCCCRKFGGSCGAAGQTWWDVTPSGGQFLDPGRGDSQSRDLKCSEGGFGGG